MPGAGRRGRRPGPTDPTRGKGAPGSAVKGLDWSEAGGLGYSLCGESPGAGSGVELALSPSLLSLMKSLHLSVYSSAKGADNGTALGHWKAWKREYTSVITVVGWDGVGAVSLRNQHILPSSLWSRLSSRSSGLVPQGEIGQQQGGA